MPAYLINQRFIITAPQPDQAAAFFLEECQDSLGGQETVYSFKPLTGSELIPSKSGPPTPLCDLLLCQPQHQARLVMEIPLSTEDFDAALRVLNGDDRSPILWHVDEVLHAIHGRLRHNPDVMLFFVTSDCITPEKQLYGAFIPGDEEAQRVYPTYAAIRDAAESYLVNWIRIIGSPALTTWAEARN